MSRLHLTNTRSRQQSISLDTEDGESVNVLLQPNETFVVDKINPFQALSVLSDLIDAGHVRVSFGDSSVYAPKILPPVDVASTANVATLAASTVVDGVTLDIGDRVLLKDQSDATQNGIYVVTTSGSHRASDLSVAEQFIPYVAVFAMKGSVNAGKAFVLEAETLPILGTSNITWVDWPSVSSGGGGGGSPWTEASGNIHRATGSVTIGATSSTINGLAVVNKDYGIIANDGSEWGFIAKRSDIPAHGDATPGNNPTFSLFRVYTAGIGLPAFRVLYSDDNTVERTIFSCESSGTMASVGDGTLRPYFEAYWEDGEVVPVTRIVGRGEEAGRFDLMSIEFGPGDNTEVDTHIGRYNTNQGYLGWGNPNTAITQEFQWEPDVCRAVNSLVTPKLTASTQFIQAGTREIYQRNVTSADSPYTVDNTTEVYTVFATSSDIVINLPTSTGIGGRIYQFIRTDGNNLTRTVSIVPDTGNLETIDGANSINLDFYGHSVKLFNTGAGWIKIAEHTPSLGAQIRVVGQANAITTAGTFVSAASAGWSATELSGFELSNGVLQNKVRSVRRVCIGIQGSVVSSAVGAVRIAVRFNGAGDEFNTHGQTYFGITGVPQSIMSVPAYYSLSYDQTIEVLVTHLEANSSTVTFDRIGLTITEVPR